jgi:C4-dicarboxylate-specific signal transduction histidine kinase
MMRQPDPGHEVPAAGAEAIRAERMDAARNAAGAIAHEIANHLGTMRTMSHLLADEFPPSSPAREDLDIMLQAMDAAERFVKELRAFVHAEPLGVGSSDLNAVVRDAEAELRRGGRPGIAVRLVLEPDLPPVRADEARAREVVRGLLAVAAERVGERGVEVRTMRAHEADTAAGGTPRRVHLEVREGGRAVDADRLARFFEPFVASRGHEVGLTLPAIWVAVTESGGRVVAEPSTEAGTVVRVEFPTAPPAGGGPADPEGGAA